MAKAFSSGVEAMFAHSDSPMPRVNDSYAFHWPAVRWRLPVFHSSMVAIVSRPSTMRGQRVAVAASAPNRRGELAAVPVGDVVRADGDQQRACALQAQ